MPRNQTRRTIIAQAVQARRPRVTGGTTAPRSAARGGRSGLGQNRPISDRSGIGNARAFPNTATPPAAGAAPPGAAPTPWDTKAEQIVAGANRKYLNESGNFDLAEQTAKQDFGLDVGFNDYKSNPNSRAALLEQTYQQANRGTMNSAGLQLYSGSTSNRLGANRSAYGTNRDALAKSYRDALGEIGAGRTKAAEEKAEAEREAEWERIAAAEKSEPEAEAAPAAGGSGKGKGKGGKSSGQRKNQTRTAIANAVPAPPRRKR